MWDTLVRVSIAIPSGFLALPRQGERSLEALEKKLDLLVLQTLLVVPADRAGPHARALARVQAFLASVAKSGARGALRAALARVEVRAPVLGLRSGALPVEGALRAAVPALLSAFTAELGAGQRSDDVLWDAPLARLFDYSSERVLDFEPPAQGVFFDGACLHVKAATGASFALADAPGGEQFLHPIAGFGGHARLALADGNPLSMNEEHPDKSGNRIDLGERTVEEWCKAMGDAFLLIELALPALAAEIAKALQRIVPVGFEPERHLSASYREAPGLVYLTLHPSALTLAEAIIHETQHGKLNVLRWFDPVLANADSTWTKSPVRPDLRPLAGVLLAVHAFVPVAALHLRLAELGHPLASSPAFEERRAQVIAGNAAGLATLAELGQPTPIGKQVVEALEDLHRLTAEHAPTAREANLSALG